jgi:hypothetical protein
MYDAVPSPCPSDQRTRRDESRYRVGHLNRPIWIMNEQDLMNLSIVQVSRHVLCGSSTNKTLWIWISCRSVIWSSLDHQRARRDESRYRVGPLYGPIWIMNEQGVMNPQGGKSGSRDCLYPRITNGSSVSPYRQRILCILCIANGSSVSPMDPPYPRYIFYILIALSTSPVVTTCSNCILNSSQILYCGVPLGLQVLYYRDTLGFSSTVLWEYP